MQDFTMRKKSIRVKVVQTPIKAKHKLSDTEQKLLKLRTMAVKLINLHNTGLDIPHPISLVIKFKHSLQMK